MCFWLSVLTEKRLYFYLLSVLNTRIEIERLEFEKMIENLHRSGGGGLSRFVLYDGS